MVGREGRMLSPEMMKAEEPGVAGDREATHCYLSEVAKFYPQFRNLKKCFMLSQPAPW